MGQGHEHQGAGLGPVGRGVDGGALASLDHAEGRLDLPSLAIVRQVKSSAHLSAVVAGRGFVGRPADLGGDDRADLPVLPAEFVDPLGVVAGVGVERRQVASVEGLERGLLEVDDVRARTARRDGRQDQVRVAIAQQAELGETGSRSCVDRPWSPWPVGARSSG